MARGPPGPAPAATVATPGAAPRAAGRRDFTRSDPAGALGERHPRRLRAQPQFLRREAAIRAPGHAEGVPFHWHRFLWSPIDGKGGYIWLQEMKGNVEKKRLELQQKLDDEKESLNNYKQYGPLERAITFFLFDRRDLKWREESLMFANRALEEHDFVDIQRKEFIKNAERFLAYSEKVLKSRKIVSELFFLNNNLKRLPSDVLHHHVNPAVKKAMSAFTPDFGKNYVIPPMEKVHSDILKAFNSKVHYKLSPSVIASYANLLDNTLDVYGRPMK